MASTIGIKIANGEFYSIIEENSSVKKRLVLTTVHDKQRSVQIDLYKSFTKTMADALYIGSVVVENIKPRAKGEPSIELVIASTAGGEITADAIDLDTSSGTGHQVLSVSLKSLTEEHKEEDFPDFELEQQEGPPTSLYGKNLKIKKQTEPEQKKSFPLLVVILAGLLIILVCLLIWFFLIRTKPSGSDSAPPARPIAPVEQPAPPPPEPKVQPPASQTAEPQKEAPKEPPPNPAVVQAPKEPPKAAASRDRSRTAPPVASYKVPATIPKEGAAYKIRWGDTLWDIAAAFYRNPWLYPRIARFNNIKNPDLIISGTTIRIPPKN
jgi:outer membrane biosynthesis protein TonB